MTWSNRLRVAGACAALALISAVGWSAPSLAQTELKIGYMKHPIHEANVAIMEKWAEQNGVTLIKIPMAYDVFQEKVTASLTSGGDQFDIIWHNDDWGQLWEKWVEPTDDVTGMDKVAKKPLGAFINDDGQFTVVPMAHTVGTFFYRTDLLGEDEVPTTFDELVEVSKRLQDEGKVYERNNEVLTENGWKPALTEPCQEEIVDFWWDALHDSKISPPGMTSYGRDEANAIFMAGDAAFTLVDSTHYGDFNDPNKSRVAGKVGMAKFPMGPRREQPVAWNEIWGWAIPKGVPEERKKLAKEMLGAMLTDIDGQVQQWEETDGPPPNMEAWDVIAEQDPTFAKLKEVVFDVDIPMHSAYYFPNWPAVHKAYSDAVIAAVGGDRDGMQTVHDAAVGD